MSEVRSQRSDAVERHITAQRLVMCYVFLLLTTHCALLTAFGQGNAARYIRRGNGAPTGSCDVGATATEKYVDSATGNEYTCKHASGGASTSGTWVLSGNVAAGTSFATPPANSVGIAASTAGVAATAPRSDATFQLDQAIAPTWTGVHFWQLNSPNALAIGPNANTNPVLRIVTNIASQADGVSITGGAAGAGTTFTALSSGSNSSLILTPKGTGQVLFPDGVLATPAFGFTANSSAGFYRTGSNAFSAAANSTQLFDFGTGDTRTRVPFTVGTTALAPQLGYAADSNLRLGRADAAAAVSQTFSVQNVVAGTSNTAGANFTIAGSQGTGTGAGGSLIFQTAPAGGSGTAQNALATAVSINSAGVLNSVAYATATNCTDSAGAAACGSAAAGSVVIDASATSVVVSTTAVTANSQIIPVFDSSLGARLSVTCNTTSALPWISARSAGSSFTISIAVAPITNPGCFSFLVIN